MDEQLKHRLVGAVVLVTAAVVIVPMILGRSDDERAPSAPRSDEAEHAVVAPRDDGGLTGRVLPLDATRPPDAASDTAHGEPGAGAARVQGAPTAPARARGESDAPRAQPADAEPRFAVQLGSFAEEKNATALRDRLLSKGYRAYVETSSGGANSTTRVLVGPQSDREEAEKMLLRLRGETKLEGLVVRYRG